MKKRVVITGGPGAGKTSLINELNTLGYPTFSEYSRTLIEKAQNEGKLNYFLSEPHRFSEALFQGRKIQFEKITEVKKAKNSSFVFYDRGIHDIYAYLKAINHHSEAWYQKVTKFQYDMVFLLEPWETIYKQDEHRLETFEEAKNYFSFIQEIYMERHRVVLVPKSSVSSRVVFIEEYLKNHE